MRDHLPAGERGTVMDRGGKEPLCFLFPDPMLPSPPRTAGGWEG